MLIWSYVLVFILMELIFNLIQLKSTTEHLLTDCICLEADGHCCEGGENIWTLYNAESRVISMEKVP